MKIDSGESTSYGTGRIARLSRTERRFLAVAACAALTAVAARIAVPLPGTAVPFTLQIVAVMLSGVILGPRLGAGSQVLYLGAGLAGLPVFVAGGGPAYLLGPTGGYLIAFPLAAATAGFFAWRFSGMGWMTLGCALAVSLVHVGGASWIAITLGRDLALGAFEPFLAGDVLKIVLVLLIGSRLGNWSKRLLG
jgi:biotin transport system substrate-specific component